MNVLLTQCDCCIVLFTEPSAGPGRYLGAAAFIAISQKRGTLLSLRGVAWNLKERLAASRFKGALSELQGPSIVSALTSATKHETYAQIIAVWSGVASTTSIAHAARTS
jgi:hypothetical protein